MTTTALAVSNRNLTPDVFKMVTDVAPAMHAARLFGTKSPEQAMAIMIKGYELGFSLTASFENIHVIEDKPSLSPKGALALIYNSPECAGVTITDEADSKGVPVACTIEMKRRNGLTYTARFSMEDAKRAGIVRPNSGWEKYPANMLRWRAIGYAADIVFPDVIGGTKRADEFGADLTPDGDVIEGSWTNPHLIVSAADAEKLGLSAAVSQPKPAMDANRLQALLATYGPEKVLGLNGGKIPGTNAELDAIESELVINGEK